MIDETKITQKYGAIVHIENLPCHDDLGQERLNQLGYKQVRFIK